MTVKSRSQSKTNEKPILFSDPMVRALLNGSKTHTRRIIKPTWSRCLDLADDDDRAKALAMCPYGQPGTNLWVRECFTLDHARFYPHHPIIYRADGYDPLQAQGPDPDHPGEVFSPEQKAWYPFRWKPSIFLPREQCRIVLKVKDVRIEALQDVTEEDAINEGMERNCHEWNLPRYLRKCPSCSRFEMCASRNEFIHDGLGDLDDPVTARDAFRYLWGKINGETEFGWDANPWVFVVSFERIKP